MAIYLFMLFKLFKLLSYVIKLKLFSCYQYVQVYSNVYLRRWTFVKKLIFFGNDSLHYKTRLLKISLLYIKKFYVVIIPILFDQYSTSDFNLFGIVKVRLSRKQSNAWLVPFQF